MKPTPGNILRRLADNGRPGSLADRFRRKRFELLRSLLDAAQTRGGGRLRILDVGGTASFWERMGFGGTPGCEIVLLNLYDQEVPSEHMRSVVGSAADLCMFPDGAYDVVVSNSVIEHLPDLELQRRMAAEIERIGLHHWVQTPNKRFPLEPHFLFPFFQYLPVAVRSWFLGRMDLGWYPRERDPQAARAAVLSVRLLTGRELRSLFPRSRIVAERAFGFVKSFIVIQGWDETSEPPEFGDGVGRRAGYAPAAAEED